MDNLKALYKCRVFQPTLCVFLFIILIFALGGSLFSAFHPIDPLPLGRFGLVVAMSVCIYGVPSPCDFLASVDRASPSCGPSLALAWSPKNGRCSIIKAIIKSIIKSIKSRFLWYRCYYPHRSRDSVSPVCGIFSILLMLMIYSRQISY